MCYILLDRPEVALQVVIWSSLIMCYILSGHRQNTLPVVIWSSLIMCYIIGAFNSFNTRHFQCFFCLFFLKKWMNWRFCSKNPVVFLLPEGTEKKSSVGSRQSSAGSDTGEAYERLRRRKWYGWVRRKCLQSSVDSLQPFLLRAKRMSGSAVQGKQLQRLPHAFSVQVVWYAFEPMGKPIGYNPARLQRALRRIICFPSTLCS